MSPKLKSQMLSKNSKNLIFLVTVVAIPGLITIDVLGNVNRLSILQESWGSLGSGGVQTPNDISVDSSGNVYVTDVTSEGNHGIHKFDSNGKFISTWGRTGSGDGQFKTPAGITIDTSGMVYIVDWSNNITQKLDSNGKFITKWGGRGSGDGQFSGARGISVDASGNVYVADTLNHRIQKFDSNGKFITKWGSEDDGQSFFPSAISVDSSGNVYVEQWCPKI